MPHGSSESLRFQHPGNFVWIHQPFAVLPRHWISAPRQRRRRGQRSVTFIGRGNTLNLIRTHACGCNGNGCDFLDGQSGFCLLNNFLPHFEVRFDVLILDRTAVFELLYVVPRSISLSPHLAGFGYGVLVQSVVGVRDDTTSLLLEQEEPDVEHCIQVVNMFDGL